LMAEWFIFRPTGNRQPNRNRGRARQTDRTARNAPNIMGTKDFTP
jgi:hypothetical protein